ncbi:MAG: phosphatidylglycerophosphatase A [Nitrospirota bacterium]
MRGPILFLATGAYAGYVPIAPGTAGSLVGLAVYAAAGRHLSAEGLLLVIGVLFLIGSWAAHRAEAYFAEKDPGAIVIDEVAGMLVSLWALPIGPAGWAAGFFLFRAFDIVKPFPIRTLERRIPGGVGVMFDDILAGVYANLSLRLILAAGVPL